MGKIIFIIGGAKSGKSNFAVKLAKKQASKVAFIATCEAKDLEMKKKIAAHKKNRPAHWETFEEFADITSLLNNIGFKFKVIILDCLTLLLTNFLLKGAKEEDIEYQIKEMLNTLKKIKSKTIIVSNEVGLDIVPKNKLARKFRDLAGKVNQMVAKESNEVFFLVAGIPWKMKGDIER